MLKTAFKTYLADGNTKIEGEAKVRKQCEDDKGHFCGKKSVTCEQK